uniref:Uncharacterized protein n=1 Tax=Arundo donax TaxID=35708 RepID=A0A0A9G7T4_ARUDO
MRVQTCVMHMCRLPASSEHRTAETCALCTVDRCLRGPGVSCSLGSVRRHCPPT